MPNESASYLKPFVDLMLRHDVDFMIIGLEDLIRIKKHIRRPKDQESLLQLLAIRKAREDTGLR